MASKNRVVILVVIILAAAIIIGIISAYTRPASTPLGTPSGNQSSTSVTASSTGSSTVAVTISTSTASNGPETFTSSQVKVSFTYPGGWSLGPDMPISIDNFKHKYQSQSIIPMGGAEIGVMSTKYAGTMNDLIATELLGDTRGAITSVSAGGVACSEIPYSASYAPGYPSSNVAVYCQNPSNGLLYKIYLSYRSGDPKSAQYLSVLSSVLASMKFIK